MGFKIHRCRLPWATRCSERHYFSPQRHGLMKTWIECPQDLHTGSYSSFLVSYKGSDPPCSSRGFSHLWSTFFFPSLWCESVVISHSLSSLVFGHTYISILYLSICMCFVYDMYIYARLLI